MDLFINTGWTVFIFFFSWFSTISGVALGGYLVFKAGGNHGPLFRVRSDSPQGAVNLDEGFEEEEQEDFRMPDEAARASERFMSSFDPGDLVFGKKDKNVTPEKEKKDAEGNEN